MQVSAASSRGSGWLSRTMKRSSVGRTTRQCLVSSKKTTLKAPPTLNDATFDKAYSETTRLVKAKWSNSRLRNCMQLRISTADIGVSLFIVEGTNSLERRMRKWLPQDLSGKLDPSTCRAR
jgi:ribosomal protein S12